MGEKSQNPFTPLGKYSFYFWLNSARSNFSSVKGNKLRINPKNLFQFAVINASKLLTIYIFVN